MEEKLKLEEELKFLKESLDSGIITQEEYQTKKESLDNKIKELSMQEEKDKSEIKESKRKNNHKKDKEIPDNKNKIKNNNSKDKKENKNNFSKEESTNEIMDYVKVVDINGKEVKKERKKEKKNNILLPIIIILVILAALFSVPYLNEFFNINNPENEPACQSNSDCIKEGSIGICASPGEKDAVCEFKKNENPIECLILSSKECFNCDTKRIEKILLEWFPESIKKEVDINSEEGKALISDLDISLIPAVIFKENLKDSDKYKEYSSIFKEKDNYFILSESAANSNYFINREEIKNKIEVFLKKDEASSLKAEKNMEEFLKTFNKIEFKKYYVDSNNELIKELKINTFPTFLLNNKLKFSGIIPAETIKENFCSMNDLEECKVRLSSKLI